MQTALGVEPLLLLLERSQLRWFGHLEFGCLPSVSLGRSSLHVPLGRDPGADSGPDGGITTSNWPGNAQEEVVQESEVWSCCSSDPTPDKGLKMDGLMDVPFIAINSENNLCCLSWRWSCKSYVKSNGRSRRF